MPDLKATTELACANAQAGIVPKAGQMWLRGNELVLVEAATDEEMRWRTDDGVVMAGTRQAFLSLAVELVPMVPVVKTYNFLEHAWQIASARWIDADIRVTVLGRTLKRGRTDVDRLTVRRWSSTLSQGMEPTR